MQDSLAVGAVDSQGDLLHQQDFLFQAELAQRQVKRLAVDVLHRNVRLALKLPGLEHLGIILCGGNVSLDKLMEYTPEKEWETAPEYRLFPRRKKRRRKIRKRI